MPWLKGRSSNYISDSDLIAGCLAGDASAWDALIDRYSPLINTVTIRMGLNADDGADILQDVSVQMFQHLEDLRDHVRLAAWVITLTRRTAWRLRKRRGMPPISTVDEHDATGARPLLGEEAAHPEDAVVTLAEHERIRQSVERLPALCRQLLEMLYYRDPPAAYSDAAAELGLATGSIGPNRARCLQKLRKFLDEDP